MLPARASNTGAKRELRPLILLGAGGHAKVLLSLAQALERSVIGVCDPNLAAKGLTNWRGIPVLGDDGVLEQLDPSSVELLNGIGQVVGCRLRQTVHQQMRRRGFVFATIIHPTAWVDGTAKLADGVQVMAGAIIQADCAVEEDCIINTAASIDHDCHLGEHTHVAPGATLCGGVIVGSGAFIGSGATIIQAITVGSRSVIAAGTVAVQDVPDGQLLMGGAASLRRSG